MLAFAYAFRSRAISLSKFWTAASALLSFAGSIFVGLSDIWLDINLAVDLLGGICIGVGWALLFLLWVDCFMRAPQVHYGVAVLSCGAVRILPIVVISCAMPIASWIFTSVLPIISACMLGVTVKKDVQADSEKVANKVGRNVSLPVRPRLLIQIGLLILFLSALVSVPSGTGTVVGVGIVGSSEGVLAALSSFVSLGLAVCVAVGLARLDIFEYLRWTVPLAVIGALFYFQPFEWAWICGVALFRIVDNLVHVAIFDCAIMFAREKHAYGWSCMALLFASSQIGDLIGNMLGFLWGEAHADNGEFVLMCLFAGLCLFALAMFQSGEKRIYTTVSTQSACGDEIESTCDAIAKDLSLSQRQRDVLAYLARGRTVSWISNALSLSENTVASYAKQLYACLGVHSKQELIDHVSSMAFTGR